MSLDELRLPYRTDWYYSAPHITSQMSSAYGGQPAGESAPAGDTAVPILLDAYIHRSVQRQREAEALFQRIVEGYRLLNDLYARPGSQTSASHDDSGADCKNDYEMSSQVQS